MPYQFQFSLFYFNLKSCTSKLITLYMLCSTRWRSDSNARRTCRYIGSDSTSSFRTIEINENDSKARQLGSVRVEVEKCRFCSMSTVGPMLQNRWKHTWKCIFDNKKRTKLKNFENLSVEKKTLSTALGFEPRSFDCRSTALTTKLHWRLRGHLSATYPIWYATSNSPIM